MFGSNAPSHCCNSCNNCQQHQQHQQQQPGASSESRLRQQRRGSRCGGQADPCCSCQQPGTLDQHRAGGGRNSWPPSNIGGAASHKQQQPQLPQPQHQQSLPPPPVASASGGQDAARWSGDDGFVPRPGASFFSACRLPYECAPPVCAPLPVDPAVSGRAVSGNQALMGLYGPPEHLRHHSGLVVRHPTEKKYGYVVPLCVCNCGQFVQGRNGVLLKCRSMLG